MSLKLDPAFPLLLRRGMRRGLLTLRRESGWAMSLGALLGVVLLLQLTIVGSLGVAGVQQLLRAQTDLRLQLLDTADDAGIQRFLVALRGQPSVEAVEYITREQAYERQRRENPDLVQFLEQFTIANPFPDTVSVRLNSLSSYNDFSEFVRQSQWRDVVDPGFLSQTTDQERELRQMLRLTDAGQALSFLFVILITGILLFTVVELVRRRAFTRREEVFVERMSGAQEASVIVPFATEASALLLLSLLCGSVLTAFLLYELPVLIPAFSPGGVFDALRAEIMSLMGRYGSMLVVLQILLVPVAGWLGAWWGTRGSGMNMASV